MTSTSYTRPIRRPASGSELVEPSESTYHAPYLHENCDECEQALLDTIDEGLWDDAALIPTLGEAYFGESEIDSFNLYRHFHPGYVFNNDPYESSFVPVALPGKPLLPELEIGDLVIARNVLSNKNYQAIVTNPVLRAGEFSTPEDGQKPGAYVEVYGNFWGDTNSKGFIRVSDSHGRTPSNILILRKRWSEEAQSSDESFTEAPEVQEHKLSFVKYGKGGGYMYGGDRSINYSQLVADNNLSDFEAKTARHFLETEGGIDSINTYDNQVITWGFGFAGKSGNFTIALHTLLASNETARSDFQSFGIVLTSEKKSDLSITTEEKTYTGDGALEFWKLNKRYLNILIQLTQQYAKDAFLAQWITFKRIHRVVFTAFSDPAYLQSITDETEKNKAKAAVLHAHHHYPGFNPPGTFKDAVSFEDVLRIYVNQSSKYGSVQGHADSWRKSINKIFSGSSAPLPTPVPPSPKPSNEPSQGGLLRGSVGRGGQNHIDDVLKVQALLNGVGIPIPVNGQISDNEGDVTILAIYRYQGKKKMKFYDGRVDPNGGTIKGLVADAKLPFVTGSAAGEEKEVSQNDVTEAEPYESDLFITEDDASGADALEFEWMNIKPARHPRGYERLYYVTTGAKGAYESCYFPFSIRNNLEYPYWPNGYGSLLLNVYAQVQLTRTSGKKQVKWKQLTKGGEKTSIWKKLALAGSMGPKQKLVFGKGVEVKQDMLQMARAIDNDDLSARMDIEVYFTKGFGGEHNKKKSLLFYLVRPIEYVFGTTFSVKPDKKKERTLVISLRKRLMAVPAHLKTSVSITISKTDTSAQSQTFNVQASTERTSGQEIKLTIPFSKLLDGLGLEASLSKEVKEAIAYSYTTEQSFSSEEGQSVTYSVELPAVRNKYKYRQIFLEPKLTAVPIDKAYHYTDINELGIAGKVEEIDIPFMYKIDGWNINIDEFTDG
jgi:hypothetical protein